VMTSSSNTFKNAVDGMDLTITGTSTMPVTVSSARSSEELKMVLQTFVENYNTYQNYLNTQTFYDVTVNAGNYLYNSRVAKEFQRAIPEVLLKQVHGIPGITSLRDLGITMRSNTYDTAVNTQTNTLTFDEEKFDALYASNPEAVQAFFFQERTTVDNEGKETTVKTGWAQAFMDVANSLAGDEGIIYKEIDKLTVQIDKNDEDIARMTARLAVKEQQMLKKFYAMEQAMAKMSSDMSAVSAIATTWQSNYSSTGSY